MLFRQVAFIKSLYLVRATFVLVCFILRQRGGRIASHLAAAGGDFFWCDLRIIGVTACVMSPQKRMHLHCTIILLKRWY